MTDDMADGLYRINPAAYVGGELRSMSARPLICERCRRVVVPEFTPYRWMDVIRMRTRKGRMIYYCDEECRDRHASPSTRGRG